MNISYYKEFEDRFRGPRNVIKQRLQVYLPFLKPLKKIYAEVNALDLGCGRGEFLEILIENGFTAKGVDLNDDMLTACQEANLKVEKGEALSHLKKCKEDSLEIISAIHFAEHMALEDIYSLIEESIRVLKPAGLLILETPNPENIVVGSSTFYIDPTHFRPIPVELLKFLIEHNGFEKTKVLRLQEVRNDQENNFLSLFSVLNGVSQDYAIVAQKKAAPEILEIFSDPFDKKYGYNLSDRIIDYDMKLEKKIASNFIEDKIIELEKHFASNEHRQNEIKQKQDDFEKEVKYLKQNKLITEETFHTIEQKGMKTEEEMSLLKLQNIKTEEWITSLQEINIELINKLELILTSKSWNYTKPLRWINNYLHQKTNKKRK